MTYNKISDAHLVSDTSRNENFYNTQVNIVKSDNEYTEINHLNCSVQDMREVSNRASSVIEVFADKVFCNEVLEIKKPGCKT